MNRAQHSWTMRGTILSINLWCRPRRRLTRRTTIGRNGFIFFASIGATLILTIIGASFLFQGISQSTTSQRAQSQAAAFSLAEAGIEQAAINLKTPNDTTDDVTTAVLSSGTFTIAPPRIVNGFYQVIATGVSNQEQRRIEVVYKLSPQSVFQFALFGKQNVNVSGSAFTDSYDSRLGAYNNNQSSPSYNKDHHGDIGTNATTTGGVALSGSIFVDGQVAVGPNVSNPTSIVTGYNPAFITGGTSPPSDTQDVLSHANAMPFSAVTVPGSLTCNDYTITGGTTLTLAPGTYCYHDLTIQGHAILTTTGVGSVTVYLTGALIARGDSSVGYTPDPRKMSFLMAGGSQATMEQGTLTGSTEFYGSLYGPEASINISGNAEVFGSIIAQSVNVTGSAVIHYDKALTDQTNVPGLYKPTAISWREL